MVKLKHLKKEAKRKQNENLDFRMYLQEHADPQELDRQINQLHQELFNAFDCKQCRNCCKEYGALFFEEEIPWVATFLQTTREELIWKYMARDGDLYYLEEKPCMFLQKDGSCRLGDVKPICCVDFPYTHYDDRIHNLTSMIEYASICPVVFELLERLKELYGFKTAFGLSK